LRVRENQRSRVLSAQHSIGLRVRTGVDDAHSLPLQSDFKGSHGLGIVVDENGCDSLCHLGTRGLHT